jgi:hypothetical protein
LTDLGHLKHHKSPVPLRSENHGITREPATGIESESLTTFAGMSTVRENNPCGRQD